MEHYYIWSDDYTKLNSSSTYIIGALEYLSIWLLLTNILAASKKAEILVKPLVWEYSFNSATGCIRGDTKEVFLRRPFQEILGIREQIVTLTGPIKL